MEIKLYLRKINQEMIDSGRRKGPISRETGKCDIYGSWTKQCCILDFKEPSPGEEVELPRRGWFMRKEEVGGLIWDPRTSAVYQLDEEAFQTLLELDHGLNELQIARRMQLPVRKVKGFVGELRKLAQ